jgi:pimeloyl-ACP methyl ester carboxylesterase
MAARMPLDLTPPEPRENLRVTSADGVELSVELHGVKGGPLVILSHGWTCSTHFWAPVLHRLAIDHEVVAYDQRGHGRSERPSREAIHAEALADDLSAVLTATVPAHRRGVLVGHSLGAMAVVAFAARHHEQLRRSVGAVLLASTGVDELAGRLDLVPVPGRGHGVPDNVARVIQFFVRGGLSDSLLLHSLPLPLARQAIRHITLSSSATAEQTAFCTDVVLSCSRLTHHWVARLLHGLDLSGDVPRLDVPTLVLVGNDDRLTPPWHSQRLVQLLPAGLGLVELPGVGHMSPVQAPDAVTQAVHQLVEEYLAAPGPGRPAPTTLPRGRRGEQAARQEAG